MLLNDAAADGVVLSLVTFSYKLGLVKIDSKADGTCRVSDSADAAGQEIPESGNSTSLSIGGQREF